MKTIQRNLLHLFLILFFSACTVNKVKSQMKSSPITYELAMPNPNSHYFEVTMTVDLSASGRLFDKSEYLDFKMPIWTPGSYLIREYAKNVETFEAKSGTNLLKVNKISKNTWRVLINNNKTITVKYLVYAYELTVRNSYLDNLHGYVNGASMFMFIPQLLNEKSVLKVNPHASFKKISVALPEIAKNTFEVENFDMLVDSPIEIGNHDIIEFEAQGVKHTIANFSNQKLTYDKGNLIADYIKVINAAASVVGEKHPCKNYLFIVHHLPQIGGGLEHLNSTTCQTSPDVYQNEAKYKSFLGLLAHEYFHLWNIKRIRPVALGPFDYENENYTNMLWVSEGFTSFYQDDLLRRANFFDEKEFLNHTAVNIATIENMAGNKVQSAAESSWDAWIKFYRPNENSNNSTVSYYTKGGVLANVLNMIIIDETKGEKSLDDVFRLLWKDIYLGKNRGFTDEEFRKACESVSGKDLNAFFEKHIFGTETIAYKNYFKNVGIDYSTEDIATTWAGVGVNGTKITKVEKGSGAYENGLYVNDEILSVDNKNFTAIEDLTKNKIVGDVIKVKVVRSGSNFEIEMPLKANPSRRFILKATDTKDPLLLKKYNKYMHK